jgi:amylosucrase
MPWPPPEDTGGVREALRALVQARKGLPHLHASVPARVLDPHDPGVLLVARDHPLGPMLGAYNVTDTHRVLPHQALREVGLDPGGVIDRITGDEPDAYPEAFHLPPYRALWLTATGT